MGARLRVSLRAHFPAVHWRRGVAGASPGRRRRHWRGCLPSRRYDEEKRQKPAPGRQAAGLIGGGRVEGGEAHHGAAAAPPRLSLPACPLEPKGAGQGRVGGRGAAERRARALAPMVAMEVDNNALLVHAGSTASTAALAVGPRPGPRPGLIAAAGLAGLERAGRGVVKRRGARHGHR